MATLALNRFFSSAVRQNNATGFGALLFHTTNDNTILQWTNIHLPFLIQLVNISINPIPGCFFVSTRIPTECQY